MPAFQKKTKSCDPLERVGGLLRRLRPAGLRLDLLAQAGEVLLHLQQDLANVLDMVRVLVGERHGALPCSLLTGGPKASVPPCPDW